MKDYPSRNIHDKVLWYCIHKELLPGEMVISYIRENRPLQVTVSSEQQDNLSDFFQVNGGDREWEREK